MKTRKEPHTSAIETLETRIAPAGMVTLTQIGGTLKIVGDADPNGITISQTMPGEYVITGEGGTFVALGDGLGSPSKTVAGVTGDVVIDLKEDDDTIRLSGVLLPKSLIVNFGAGDTGANSNTLILENSAIGKDLTVNGYASGDDIQFGGFVSAVNGNATFKLGDGFNDLNFAATTRNQIFGNLIYVGGAGQDDIRSDDDMGGPVTPEIGIGGSVLIKAGDGSNRILLEPTHRLTVGKSLQIENPTDADTLSVTIQTQDAAGVTAIGGNLTIKNGNGVSTNTLDGGSSFSVGGLTTIKNGDHAAGLTVNTFSGGAFTFGKGLIIQNGTGDSFTTMTSISTVIGGKLSVSAKAGTDNVSLFSDLLDFRGGVNLSLGAGNSTSSINGSLLNINKGVVLKGQAGTDTLSLVGTGTISGSVLIDFGGGITQDAVIASSGSGLTIAGNLKVKTGRPGAAGTAMNVTTVEVTIAGGFTATGNNGADFVTLLRTIVGGPISITTGADGDGVSMNEVIAKGAMKISTGAGADYVRIERGGTAGVAAFLKAVALNLGDGDDQLEIGAGTGLDRAVFFKTVKLDGGRGNDTRDVLPNGNIFQLSTQPLVVSFEVGS